MTNRSEFLKGCSSEDKKECGRSVGWMLHWAVENNGHFIWKEAVEKNG